MDIETLCVWAKCSLPNPKDSDNSSLSAVCVCVTPTTEYTLGKVARYSPTPSLPLCWFVQKANKVLTSIDCLIIVKPNPNHYRITESILSFSLPPSQSLNLTISQKDSIK